MSDENQTQNPPGTGLASFTCHKRVRAGLILDIDFGTRQLKVLNAEGNSTVIFPGSRYFTRNDPQIGGYYVVYEDGFVSFSPAEPFSKGYTRDA